MRARTYKAAHRNLADSKRSIVMMVAGLAMILGTTSVGASMFTLNSDPMAIERTGSSVSSDANGDNEVAIDEPTIQILQGQATIIQRKTHASLAVPRKESSLQISSVVTAPLLSQIHQSSTPQQTTTPTTAASDPTGGDSGSTGGSNPSTGSGGTTGGDSDPGGDIGTGDSGEVTEDPAMTPDEDVQTDTSLQQPATGTTLQGSGTAQGTTT